MKLHMAAQQRMQAATVIQMKWWTMLARCALLRQLQKGHISAVAAQLASVYIICPSQDCICSSRAAMKLHALAHHHVPQVMSSGELLCRKKRR